MVVKLLLAHHGNHHPLVRIRASALMTALTRPAVSDALRLTGSPVPSTLAASTLTSAPKRHVIDWAA